MAHLTLITGGARSGKSTFAEERAASCGSKIVYIATAQPLDAEMEDRIARHRQQRPSSWHTVEEPLSPSRVIQESGDQFDVVLLDCLTVLTTNLIFQNQGIDWDKPPVNRLAVIEQQVIDEMLLLVDAVKKVSGMVFCVTNEVGLGIVPDTPLARFFRDCNGRVNQLVAREADDVFLVVSTIPVQVKGK
jgi:adenosylcobinamide kinase/adenosylcobinamide-phosphate guanylyltransferase